MFGEAFDGDDALVGSYTQPGRLDSVFYFPQKFQVFGRRLHARRPPPRRSKNSTSSAPRTTGTEPRRVALASAPHDVLINFIDNHDLPRFLFETDDVRALRASLAYLLTEDGVPCLYYGTEQDFAGGNDPGQPRSALGNGHAS